MNPPSLPPETREYYREVWGFDPVDDCKSSKFLCRGYSQGYELEGDPYFQAAGIQIIAMVDVKGENVHNTIMFVRGNRWYPIDCTHTVVFSAPPEEALTFADDLSLEKWSSQAERDLLKKAGGPVILAPWEHFAALKSYVASIAECGIGNILLSIITKENIGLLDYPFGFNSAMQQQVFTALRKVAPRATKSLLRDIFLEILETSPVEWVNSRLPLLDDLYDLKSVILSDPPFFDQIQSKLDLGLLSDMSIIYGKTSPKIRQTLARLSKNLPIRKGSKISSDELLNWLKSDRRIRVSDKGFSGDLERDSLYLFLDEGDLMTATEGDTWCYSTLEHFLQFESEKLWRVIDTYEDEENRDVTKRQFLVATEEWRHLSIIFEIAEQETPEQFLSQLIGLDQSCGFKDLILNHPLVFERIDAATHLPLFRIMAAVDAKTHPAILDYITRNEFHDIGIRQLIIQHPKAWDITVQRAKRVKVCPLDEEIPYCGTLVPKKEALILREIQEHCGNYPLIFWNNAPSIYCYVRHDEFEEEDESIPKHGSFMLYEGHVSGLDLSGLERSSLPDSVRDLSHLTWLRLNNNNLRKYPKA